MALGQSQGDLQLSSNLSSSFVCPGEGAAYTCTTNQAALLWTVPPFVHEFAFFFFNVNNISAEDIFLYVVSSSPLSSVLIISYNVSINATNVTCRSGEVPVTLHYQKIRGKLESLNNVVEYYK